MIRKSKIQMTLVEMLMAFSMGCSNDVEFESLPKPGEGQNGSNEVPSDPPGGEPSEPDPIYKTDSFVQQQEDAAVDVLFVVDNSGSMYEEQQKLGSRISSFLDHLTQVDWQVGVTTTDVSSGTYGMQGSLLPFGNSDYVLTPDHNNYEEAFLDTIVREETENCETGRGACPSASEQPLAAMIMAHEKRNSVNSGFFRDNSDLVVVVLSDEDEMSDNPSSATKADDVLEYFDGQLQNTTKRFDVYGIIVEPGDTSCYNEQSRNSGHYGTQVAELAQSTKGLLGSICDSDYSRNLASIGERVGELLNTVELSETPVPDSVVIELVPEASNVEFTVEGKVVKFQNPPQEGTRINVTYQVQTNNDDDKDDNS